MPKKRKRNIVNPSLAVSPKPFANKKTTKYNSVVIQLRFHRSTTPLHYLYFTLFFPLKYQCYTTQNIQLTNTHNHILTFNLFLPFHIPLVCICIGGSHNDVIRLSTNKSELNKHQNQKNSTSKRRCFATFLDLPIHAEAVAVAIAAGVGETFGSGDAGNLAEKLLSSSTYLSSAVAPSSKLSA